MKTSTKIITGAALLAGTLSSTSLNASADTTNQTAADTNVRTTQTVTAPVIKTAGDGVQATKKLASSATTTVSKATKPAQTAPVKATTHKVVPLNATATVSATALNDAVQSQVEKDPTVQAAKQTTNKIHSQLDAAKKTDDAAQQELAQQETAYQAARAKQHEAEQNFAATQTARDKGYDHKAQAQKDQQTAESKVTDALHQVSDKQAAQKEAQQAVTDANKHAVAQAGTTNQEENQAIADLTGKIENGKQMAADATQKVAELQPGADKANAAAKDAKDKVANADAALKAAQKAKAESTIDYDQAQENYNDQVKAHNAADEKVAKLQKQIDGQSNADLATQIQANESNQTKLDQAKKEADQNWTAAQTANEAALKALEAANKAVELKRAEIKAKTDALNGLTTTKAADTATQVQTLQKEIADLNTELETLNTAVKTAQDNANKAATALDTAKTASAAAEKAASENTDAHAQLVQQQTDAGKLQQQLEAAKEEAENAAHFVPILKAVFDQAQKLVDAVTQAEQALKTAQDDAKTKLAIAKEAQGKLDAAKFALDTVNADVTSNSAMLAQIEKNIADRDSASDAAVAEALLALDQAESELKQAQATLEAAKRDGDAAVADENAADVEIAKAEADFRVAKQAVRDDQDKVAAISSEVAKAKAAAAKTSAAVIELSAALSQAQATLDQKRQAVLAHLTAQPAPASTTNKAGCTTTPETTPAGNHRAGDNEAIVPVAAAATGTISDGRSAVEPAGDHSATLPQTNESTTGAISLLGVVLLAIAGMFGFKTKKRVIK